MTKRKAPAKTQRAPATENALLEQTSACIHQAENLALAAACSTLESAMASPLRPRPICMWDRWSEESRQRASFEWRASCPAEADGTIRMDVIFHNAFEVANGRRPWDNARYESTLSSLGLDPAVHDIHSLAIESSEAVNQFSKAVVLLIRLDLFDDFWQSIQQLEASPLSARAILERMGRADALPLVEQELINQSTRQARASSLPRKAL